MEKFDVREARKTLERRERTRHEKMKLRLEEARADFDNIVALLIEKYRPARIYQWGSLLEPEKFTERSDIDIAIEGLKDPIAGLHAQADAERVARFPVDLVELERVHPRHAESIRTQGKLIYERG